MGMTQQRFAVEVVKTAIGTVAVWETSNPPHGETLLRLAEVALQAAMSESQKRAKDHVDLGQSIKSFREPAQPDAVQQFLELCATFRGLFLEEVFSSLGAASGDLLITTRPGISYLLARIEDDPAKLKAAHKLMQMGGERSDKRGRTTFHYADADERRKKR
jgi:hypothetical protein